jgi:hypothetical protein
VSSNILPVSPSVFSYTSQRIDIRPNSIYNQFCSTSCQPQRAGMCGDQWTKRSRTILTLLITLWSVRSFLELARESIHTITAQRESSRCAVLLKVPKLDYTCVVTVCHWICPTDCSRIVTLKLNIVFGSHRLLLSDCYLKLRYMITVSVVGTVQIFGDNF